MSDTPRKFFTLFRIFLILVALFVLDILGGVYIPKLVDKRAHSAFKNIQCNISNDEFKKIEWKKTTVCKSDAECVLVPGQCGPYAVNREYICAAKAAEDRGYQYSAPKEDLPHGRENPTPFFKQMSCMYIGPWKPLPHAFPALRPLLYDPVCTQGMCSLHK